MNSTALPCRYCDCVGHHASRLRAFDWPLYFIGFAPIRCKNCGVRSYRRRSVVKGGLAVSPAWKDDRLN